MIIIITLIIIIVIISNNSNNKDALPHKNPTCQALKPAILKSTGFSCVWCGTGTGVR